ncbi:hypothetical protein BDV28DRAFT_126980 [Aspergillus coremiiformis]|uniref:Uncharacterized protein n=1 Tax=Aspergillus coremiiformis TaxID=138285 RepID=A0A5N6ZFN2_9EURO|nr:hypothetical protein BDV28DRAFT_126980 [Aspergillus coremiiformis]
MGGVPLNTFKQIKESLKKIFKRKKKGDNTPGAAGQTEDGSQDATATGAAGATTGTNTTQQAPAPAPAPESHGVAPVPGAAAGTPPSLTPGISPGTSIPEHAANNSHNNASTTPMMQIPPIETSESASPSVPTTGP